MKSINDWQKALSEAAEKKFPNNATWTQKDRLLAVHRQLADLSGALQNEEGILVTTNHAHEDPDHRIACTIMDLLLLAEMRGADIEKEFGKALIWLEDKTTIPGQ